MRRSFDAMDALRAHEVVKFFPNVPPQKGEAVLVRGVRCIVTKIKVRWRGSVWEIRTFRARGDM